MNKGGLLVLAIALLSLRNFKRIDLVNSVRSGCLNDCSH